MITADQLVAHAVGDYILQSDWMANEKTKKSVAALAHALAYTLPFLLLRPSIAAVAIIAGTHFVIDRWRLARYVCYAKNFIAPRTTWTWYPDPEISDGGHSAPNYWWFKWYECRATGYHEDRPPWMSVWLLIIADNTLHVICNGIALKYL